MNSVAQFVGMYPILRAPDSEVFKRGFNWIMSTDNTIATANMIYGIMDITKQVHKKFHLETQFIEVLNEALKIKQQLFSTTPTDSVKNQIKLLNDAVEKLKKSSISTIFFQKALALSRSFFCRAIPQKLVFVYLTRLSATV